ncbi:MAG: HNH endonuclease [Thermoflexales bacterium]
MRRVLVLNATYEPLSVVPMPRAVNLILFNKAEMTEASDMMLHSVSMAMPAPLVVRLLHYVRVPRNLPMPLSRRAVLLRDGFTCQYCGLQPGKEALTIDHILPRSRGGRTDWENVTTACGACNRKKGNRLPGEAGMALLHEPTRPRFWSMALLTVPGNESWRKYLVGAAKD